MTIPPSFGHVKTLQQALDELPNCATADDLERLAFRVDEPATQPAEFNFPADVIMLVEGLEHAIERAKGREGMEGFSAIRPIVKHIRTAGEKGMLQIAFFNLGIQAPSPFIIKVHEAGWRYLGGKGFHKVAL